MTFIDVGKNLCTGRQLYLTVSFLLRATAVHSLVIFAAVNSTSRDSRKPLTLFDEEQNQSVGECSNESAYNI